MSEPMLLAMPAAHPLEQATGVAMPEQKDV